MAQEPHWIQLADEQATLDFGGSLLEPLQENLPVVYLQGDLGAGKTTLVRGLLRAAGYRGAVRSPTYTLMEPYELAKFRLYHFDLYRLEYPDELEFIGGRDYLGDAAIRMLEWPERAAGWLPPADLLIRMQVVGNARQISLQWQNAEA